MTDPARWPCRCQEAIEVNLAHVRRVVIGESCSARRQNPAAHRKARPMSPYPNALSRRAIAMLKAVGDGRAELRCSCEPDLRVDGLPCCDQSTAHDLARAGLIRAVGT